METSVPVVEHAAAAPSPQPAESSKFGFSIKWLLVFVPVAAMMNHLNASAPMVFFAACLAIIPLAALMGDGTEVLADKAGAGVGGLLNATFGNAAELIISYVALSKGLHDVVKASIIGSIIGNILLVLGAATLIGGMKREKLSFNITAASSGSSMLFLSAIGLLIPAMFASTSREPHLIRSLSTEVAIILLIGYVLSLVFTLKTHKHLYTGEPDDQESGDEEGEQEPAGSVKGAVAKLFGATILVAWMSEILVGVVEEAAHAMGLTDVFIGVIVLAVVGNAAEHSTAVMMALKNKMDVAIGIAVGSSTQIALFVAPVLMLSSLFMDKPMDLVFSVPEVVAVVISVMVVGQISQDGECNWLEGVQLLSVYAILGCVFYHYR
jgi:Ca2+:H+ antiporter